MSKRFVIALLGFYLGFTTFFGFVVAPAVFSTAGAQTGGEIVSKIFPYYFAASTTVLGVSTLLTLKDDLKKVSLILLVALLISAFQEFFLFPHALQVKVSNPEGFKSLHTLSVLLNAATMLLALVAEGLLIFSKGDDKTS